MLQAKKITERVCWVGAIDWELHDFHGYNTGRGTTYNAYLILGEKPILIDTVKAPFFQEMLSRIKSVIDPKKIAYIISNHTEMDHTGSLAKAIELIKPEKVFASVNGAQALRDHFHWQNEITIVKTGDKLTLGNANLSFLETKMLHWPDSMFTYFVEEGVLFSQDAFGMHLATACLFSDENNAEVMHYEAAKYYANILMPYSQLVTNLIKQLPDLNLDIKMIAPDHGPIWRGKESIQNIISLWQKWALQKTYPKAVIFYDTMWQSTAKMAAALADGISSIADIEVKVLPLSKSHRSDVAVEILEAGALLIGSPTLNQQLFPTVADVLCYLKGLKRKNLIGQVFGSYGWAGESIKLLQDELQKMAIQPISEPVKVKYVPTEEDLSKCRNLGVSIAEELKKRI